MAKTKEPTLGELIDQYGKLDAQKKEIEETHREAADKIKKKIKTAGKHSGKEYEVNVIEMTRKEIIPVKFKRELAKVKRESEFVKCVSVTAKKAKQFLSDEAIDRCSNEGAPFFMLRNARRVD